VPVLIETFFVKLLAIEVKLLAIEIQKASDSSRRFLFVWDQTHASNLALLFPVKALSV
jgi:hypothetical protein